MMDTTLGTAARPRRWLRRIGATLALILAALGLILALALETAPRATRAPDTAAARAALAAGQTLRDFAATGGSATSLTLGDGEMDAVLAAASRLAPGVAGGARAVGADRVAVDLSLGPPHLPLGLWGNLTLEFAASPEGLGLVGARLGRLPLPPALVEAAAVRAADRVIGAPVARQVLAGVVGLRTGEAGAVTAEFGYSPEERRALIDQIRAAMGTGGRDKMPIFVLLWWIDKGGDRGELPLSGSATPYLRYAIDRADAIAKRFPQASDRELATAGLIALAMYCGEPAIGSAVGVSLDERMTGEGNHCAPMRLGGRDDLKRHFTVSAALYALSTGDAAWGVGELKELVDSGAGGSGFSFDDMAANLAGARFAAAFLKAPRAEWPAMLAQVETEADVLPDLTGLPSQLSEAEFIERFGSVDSPEYQAMIADIRARVAALPLEAARVAGR